VLSFESILELYVKEDRTSSSASPFYCLLVSSSHWFFAKACKPLEKSVSAKKVLLIDLFLQEKIDGAAQI
jgi:hypothetical protein